MPQVEPTQPQPGKEGDAKRWRVACHEAAHALIAVRTPRAVVGPVDLWPNEKREGGAYVFVTAPDGRDSDAVIVRTVLGDAAISMAGLLVASDSTGVGVDGEARVARALGDIARNFPCDPEYDRDIDRLHDLGLTADEYRKVAHYVQDELRDRWPAVEALATVAATDLRVPAAKVKQIFEEHGVEVAEGVCFDDDAKQMLKSEWNRLMEAFRRIEGPGTEPDAQMDSSSDAESQ